MSDCLGMNCMTQHRNPDCKGGANKKRADEQGNLGTALPAEMARVRDEILPMYIEIGAPGAMAASLMRADLDAAAKALAEQDVVEMLKLHEKLKGWTG